MFLRFALVAFLAVTACQKPAPAHEEAPAVPPAARGPQSAAAAHFDTPNAVYKRYAETLSAAKWADAVALFTPAGKVELVVSNFKGLAVLPGSPHPKKLAFKAVLREFCQRHTLRCADDKWNEGFVPALLAGASVKPMLSDVERLAKAQPDATYVELMGLVYGVDQSAILPLDPTLTEVKHTENRATGTARRADGQTTTMTFENTPERGWLIVE